MKKTWTVALVAVALTFGAVACSSDDDASKDATTTTQAASATSAPSGGDAGPKKETVTDVRDPQGSVAGYVGAMQDVTMETCETTDGALKVDGTVANPVGEPQQYRIYVSAMEGEDTRGIVQIDVPTVAGNESTIWATEIALSDPGLTCLLRVERFAPQG